MISLQNFPQHFSNKTHLALQLSLVSSLKKIILTRISMIFILTFKIKKKFLKMIWTKNINDFCLNLYDLKSNFPENDINKEDDIDKTIKESCLNEHIIE